MTKPTASESTLTQTVQDTQASGGMTSSMERAMRLGLTRVNSGETMLTPRRKAGESTSGPMATSTWESGKITLFKAKAYTRGVTAEFTLVNGRIT
jgi:hypothetical protein